jgi:hypothetical protein
VFLPSSEVLPTASHKDSKAAPACFAFSFKKDDEQAQEGRRREKLSAASSNSASSTNISPNSPFGFASSLLRGAGALF